MLTSTLLLLFTAPANDAWLERLDFPQLAQADVNLAVADADLGIESDDLGFPKDPRQRVAEAFERVQGGDRSALTLHQAVSGIISLRDGENFKRVMPACLSAYLEELKAAPQDTGLRLRFARVLTSGGVITRDDRFFQDAEAQLGTLLEAEPDNWRWRCEYTKLQATRVLYLGGTDSDSLWLKRGMEASEEAIKLAPLEIEPRWRCFHASYLAAVRREGSGGPGIYQRLTDLADGLIVEAREIEQPLLDLIGQSYWSIAKLGVFIADAEGGVPAVDSGVQERLDTFRKSLQAAPEGELRIGAARAWWGLSALFGTPEQVADGMDLAIEMGLSRSDAHMLALMGLHKRAEAEAAAAVALEFAQSAEGDNAWRALTVYRHETGDQAGALEAQARVKGVDPALRLARAQLHLHTGDVEVARDGLAALVSEVAGAPIAGEVGHTYGVALALTGDLDGARLQLSIASRLLGEEKGAGARATLEDLR